MTKSEGPTIFHRTAEPLSLTLLVLSGCSLMCVAATVDPLRAANRIAGQKVFDYRLCSIDGEQPATTSGLPIAVSGSVAQAPPTDVFVAIGGFGTRDTVGSALISAVRRLARSAQAVGGIEAGTWLLGRAGLLAGRRATTHWEDMEDFAAAFPDTDVRLDRYVVDGPVFTAGGAAPAFDLMLHLVRTRLGAATALDVASVFIYDQAHASTDPQPQVSLGRMIETDPRVGDAIRMMESHIEAPLTTAAIARRVGVSTRTLETLFMRAVGETPGAYFLRLRLAAARRLVLDARLPLAEIAARTGFSSVSAFSRAFSAGFGTAPSHLRDRQRRPGLQV